MAADASTRHTGRALTQAEACMQTRSANAEPIGNLVRQAPRQTTDLGETMRLEEYAAYDALGLAERVRGRQLSSAALRDLGMQAIELLNPTLNANVASTPGEEAAALER